MLTNYPEVLSRAAPGATNHGCDAGESPYSQQALRQWRQIRQRALFLQCACRLRGREESIVQTIVLDVVSVFKVAYVLAKRFTGWSLAWLSFMVF